MLLLAHEAVLSSFDLRFVTLMLPCGFDRSCGYQFRPSVPIAEIKTLCSHIKDTYKSHGRDLVIFVDNCYGELVEELEPCHVGADLVAGSLIKNLGGTLAPCGGYIAGKRYAHTLYDGLTILIRQFCGITSTG
jgi:cystathionine beta-lyase family protein involved in aluminum resistance